MVASLDRVTGWLSNGLLWLGGLAVALMMLNISADVLAKYLFQSPLHGTLEFTAHYYMPVAALAPLAYLQQTRGHVFVELFTHSFSDRVRTALDGIMSLAAVFFFGSIGWYSGIEAAQKTARNEYVYVVFFDLLTWPTRWVVPLTCLVVVLIACLQSIRYGYEVFRPGSAQAKSGAR